MKKPCAPRLEDGNRGDFHYVEGMRSALTGVLRHILSELGWTDDIVEGLKAAHLSWILEREATIACLRRVCDDYGDNDWEDTLRLTDVIDKHLVRHLDGDS